MQIMNQYRLVNMLMLMGFLLALIGWWHRNDLPDPNALDPQVDTWPIQEVTDKPTFQTSVGGVTYSIHPLFRYDIRGLVVSRHDADSIADWVHKESNDHINVVDLCVVYEDMARSGAYRPFSYRNANFTCYVDGSSGTDWSTFNHRELSNNHLLTDDLRLTKLLRGIRVGN